MTSFVSPALYAPGEQRRSGFGSSLQPLVAVRRSSRTVAPSLGDGPLACWVGAGDVGAVEAMVVAAAVVVVAVVVVCAVPAVAVVAISVVGAIVVGGGEEGVSH
jgi:hypothetical protein